MSILKCWARDGFEALRDSHRYTTAFRVRRGRHSVMVYPATAWATDDERFATEKFHEAGNVIEILVAIAVRVAVRVGRDAVLLLIIEWEGQAEGKTLLS